MSWIYCNSTMNTSERQLLVRVQVDFPVVEPSVPCQSEDQAKNRPSAETEPITLALEKNGDCPLEKV